MTTKYGTFSEPGYLHPGAIYRRGYREENRNQGGSFKTNDACFGKFSSIHTGDSYTDAQTRLQGKAKAGKAEAPTPFRSVGPMKQAPGQQAGSFYGTIGGKIPYMPDPRLPRSKGDIKHEGRQITTSPAKRGTYGFNKTTLSERKGALGVTGEYAYVADPFDKPAAAGVRGAQEAKGAPFRPATGGRVGTLFNRLEYMPRGPDVKVRHGATEGQPFKPPRSAPPALRPAGEYIPCPPKQLTGGEKRAQSAKHFSPDWRPNYSGRSPGPVVSVMRLNQHAISR